MRARPCHSDTSPSLSGTSPCRCGVAPPRRRTPALVSGTPRQWLCARGAELGCTEPISAACRAHGSARGPQRPGAGTHWAKAEAQALGAWLVRGDAPPRESGTPHGKRCVSPWMGGGRHPRAHAQDTAREHHPRPRCQGVPGCRQSARTRSTRSRTGCVCATLAAIHPPITADARVAITFAQSMSIIGGCTTARSSSHSHRSDWA